MLACASSREKEERWATPGASTKGGKEDAPAMACPFLFFPDLFTDSEKMDSRHAVPGNVPPYVQQPMQMIPYLRFDKFYSFPK
jgi:hypothetical protein